MAQIPSQPAGAMISFGSGGNSFGALKGVGGNGAAGNFTSSRERRGAGAGSIPCSGWARAGNGSEGWVSWEDPDWIHPNPFIPRAGKRALGWGLAGALFRNFGMEFLRQSRAPSVSPSQNKAHFNPFFPPRRGKTDASGMDTPRQAHPPPCPTQAGYPRQGRAPRPPRRCRKRRSSACVLLPCAPVSKETARSTCVWLNTLFAFIWISL